MFRTLLQMKRTVCLGSFLVLVLAATPVWAQDLALGEFRSYATLHSIGIEWDISGDANHDAHCSVHYRIAGSATWHEASPLFRVDSNGDNMFGGSILFLEPGTLYEIKLEASDPDGGASSRNFTITTRPEPTLPTGGSIYHVVPGSASSGGTGTEADPFRGISAADAHAGPGTIFLLHSGDYPTVGDATYSGYTIFDESGTRDNPVVWKAAGDGPVNFSGGAWITADHVWLEGLTFPGPGSGFGLLTYNDAYGGVVVRNTFTGWKQSINLEHATDFYIADNTIVGINDPNVSDYSGEGIEGFSSDGHVIAYNSISRVGDGLSVGGYNIDIYGNDIFATSDDGIELDNGKANVRAWGNRIHNALHHGISFQPMDGAPWYVLRNQVAGPNALKLVDNPTLGRILIAHNTFVGRKNFLVTFAHELAFVQSSNNLWIHVAPGDIWEAYGPDNTHWRTDLDYDGFYWHPATDYPFYWGGSNYPSFAAFQAATGLEPNGIVVGLDTCFENLDVPLEGTIPHQFMTLATGSEAVDAGRMLPGINDGYRGSRPDLGAYEFGAELPWYGPRQGDDVSPVDEGTDPDDLPAARMAVAAYPNPFNPQTTIVLSLPRGDRTRVAVFDLAGRQVAVLLDRDLVAGEHRLNWRGRDAMGREVPSGTYFVNVATSEGVVSHKVSLVR